MWIETLNRAIRDIRDIMARIPHIDDVKELNKLELKLHNMFQEYYGVLGNVTREVKQAINTQKLNIKYMDRAKREEEQNKAIEQILENTPEQEMVDASKLSDDVVAMDLNGNIVTEPPEFTEEQRQELEEIKKEVKAKKTTKKKTTKKAKK